MRYLAVRNWDSLQHYKKNTKPPWVKLYTKASDDYEYTCLSLAERGLLMEVWRLAARVENRIPDDAKWIARAVQTETNIAKPLARLIETGWIGYRPSLESVYTDSALEVEVEVEVETDPPVVPPNGSGDPEVRAVIEEGLSVREVG